MSLQDLLRALKGGKGSGDWGHRGRPGKRGGSGGGGGLHVLGLDRNAGLNTRREAASFNKQARLQALQAAELRASSSGSSKIASVPADVLSSNKYALENVQSDPAAASLGGVTESYLVNVEDDGKAIVKPDNGHWAADAESEILSYELSNELGWDIVPTTVWRDPGTYPAATGGSSVNGASAQQWVDNAIVGKDMTRSHWDKIDKQDLSRIMLFDSLIGNADRHGGNFLYKDGRLVAIDHGLAFRSDSKYATLPRIVNAPQFSIGRKAKDKGGITTIRHTREDIDKIRNLRNNKRLYDMFISAGRRYEYDNMMARADNLVTSYASRYD